MKSETFFCPHCNTKLTKSAAAFVLGETGGQATGLGSVTCPTCGKSIDAQAMVSGGYDHLGGVEWIVFFLVWGVGYFALRALELTFWPSLGLGFLAALAVLFLWDKLELLLGKRRG